MNSEASRGGPSFCGATRLGRLGECRQSLKAHLQRARHKPGWSGWSEREVEWSSNRTVAPSSTGLWSEQRLCGLQCMLLRLAVNLVVRRSASPVAATVPRLVAALPHRSPPLLIPHHRTFTLNAPLWSEKRPIMSDIKTPEVPPAQQQDAPNLQKDPETGEMVSKRSVSRVPLRL